MKNLFTIFIFSLLVFTSKAQWVELDPGVDEILYDVYAITPDIVVVVGANGTILKTTDGGETWLQKFSGTTSGLGHVQFPTPTVGYITAGGGTLLKTTDSGETWSVIDTESGFSLSGMSCVDENLIFISTNNNALLKTEDGGENWETIMSILPLLSRIEFLNHDIGFAWEQLNFNLFKTENGGGVWNEIAGASPVHFLDEQTGFYYDFGLFKTTDSGDNFVNLGEGEWGYLTDIFALNQNHVWGLLAGLLDGDPSSRGITKIYSTDSGNYTETITLENNPEIDMLSIHFADETTGYIAGFKSGKGAIWKNGTGINTMGTKEGEKNNEIKAYPNPVSNELNIILDKPTKAVITLTDITGKKVYSKTFYEDQVKINTSSFPKGTYILSVKTGNKHFTQKLLIN